VTLGNDNGRDGQTDRQTDRRTDRVRRIMRPPPREEGRIKSAQRRRKHYMLAVVRRSQKFRTAADPLLWGTGRSKFNQLEIVTTFTYTTTVW